MTVNTGPSRGMRESRGRAGSVWPTQRTPSSSVPAWAPCTYAFRLSEFLELVAKGHLNTS